MHSLIYFFPEKTAKNYKTMNAIKFLINNVKSYRTMEINFQSSEDIIFNLKFFLLPNYESSSKNILNRYVFSDLKGFENLISIHLLLKAHYSYCL